MSDCSFSAVRKQTEKTGLQSGFNLTHRNNFEPALIRNYKKYMGDYRNKISIDYITMMHTYEIQRDQNETYRNKLWKTWLLMSQKYLLIHSAMCFVIKFIPHVTFFIMR